MRKFLIAAAFATLPAVAGAQPYPDPRDEALARSLPSPGQAEAIGRVMSNVVGAVMDVPIGPLVGAIDPARRVDPGQTLGDLAGRDDPYYEERLDRTMDRIVSGMGGMAAQAAILAPVLRRSLEDFERRIGEAVDGGYRRDY